MFSWVRRLFRPKDIAFLTTKGLEDRSEILWIGLKARRLRCNRCGFW